MNITDPLSTDQHSADMGVIAQLEHYYPDLDAEGIIRRSLDTFLHEAQTRSQSGRQTFSLSAGQVRWLLFLLGAIASEIIRHKELGWEEASNAALHLAEIFLGSKPKLNDVPSENVIIKDWIINEATWPQVLEDLQTVYGARRQNMRWLLLSGPAPVPTHET